MKFTTITTRAMLALTAGAALTVATTSAANAQPATSTATSSAEQAGAAKLGCSPGGPYRVGDRAVWYNCDSSIDRIRVLKWGPLGDYDVCVAAFGKHEDSWTWTETMFLIHDGYC